MPGLVLDVRVALRQLRRSPVFTAFALASSTTAINVAWGSGTRASHACGLPSMCNNSPRQARGSRRRRWRPRGRLFGTSPAVCNACLTQL